MIIVNQVSQFPKSCLLDWFFQKWFSLTYAIPVALHVLLRRFQKRG